MGPVELVATMLLATATPNAECGVLDAMVHEVFSASQSLTDEQGRIEPFVYERPLGLAPNSFVDFLVDIGDLQASMAVVSALDDLADSNPSVARALAHMTVEDDRARLNSAVDGFDQGWIDDFANRNIDRSGWACPLAEPVVLAKEGEPIRSDVLAHRLILTRPGFSLDGNQALILAASPRLISHGEQREVVNRLEWFVLTQGQEETWSVVRRISAEVQESE